MNGISFKVFMTIIIVAGLLMIGTAVSADKPEPPFGSTTTTIEEDTPVISSETQLTIVVRGE